MISSKKAVGCGTAFFMLFACLVCGMFLSCSSDTGGGTSTTKVSSIAIAAYNDATSLVIGETLAITASVLPANASNSQVEWTVAEVNDSETEAVAEDSTADETETTDAASDNETESSKTEIFTYNVSDDTLTLSLAGVRPGKITVAAKAKDGSGVESNSLTITITNGSEEPNDETGGITAVSISSSSASIQYDGTAELTATATTTGSPTLEYKWEITEGSDYASLSESTTNTVTLTANNTTATEQTVKVTVTATDTSDSTITKTSDEFEITISAHGVAVADEVKSVTIAATAESISTVGTTTLTATPVSTGSPDISYTWKITSGSDYATLSESTTSTVTLTGTNATASEQTVTVTVTATYTVDGEEKSVEATEPVSVKVAAKTLTKIEVDTSSAVTDYTVGDEFSKVGLAVTATYSDRNSADVSSSATFDGYDLTTAVTAETKQNVTVTYTDEFGTQTTTFEITVSPKPEESEDVYAYSANDTIINLGKTNIEAKAYLTYAKAEYKDSTQTINEVTDYYANLSKTEREIDITVSGVAAFTLYVQNATEGRTFTVQIGSSPAYTVTHPGSQTIDNVSTDIASFTFNTGTTQTTTIKISGGGETVTPGYLVVYNQVQTISAASVTISGNPTSALALTDYPSGTTYNSLTATVAPAWCTNGTVSWTSSDETVATINASTGVIQPLKAGTTTIKATAGTVSDEFALTITDTTVAVTGVTLDKTALSLARWATLTLSATVAPSGATNKNVTWESDDETVATVENGEVTGVAPGTAKITVTTEDGSKTAECTVTVTPVYVSAGEYALIGAETATSEAPWTTQSALTSQTLNNIHTTTEIDDTGFLLKNIIDTTGYAEFELQTEMKVTIGYTVLKADSKTGGIVLTTTDGSFTSDSDSTATILTTQTDVISSADTNSKAAFQTLDSNSSADSTGSFVITLGAGSYKLYGYKKATSTRASSITFARTSSDNAKVTATVASADISLSTNGSTVSVTLPSDVTATAYAWYVGGDVVSATTNSYTLPTTSTVGKTYIVTAEVTINGKKYTKTTSVTYAGE